MLQCADTSTGIFKQTKKKRSPTTLLETFRSSGLVLDLD